VACAPNKVAPPGLPCNPGACFVEVVVTACHSPGGVSVNLPTLDVDATKNIEWAIQTDGFKFPTDGIVFADAQFVRVGVTGSGKKFTVTDKFTSLGPFKYTVNLVDAGGSACVPLDPFVNNK